MNCYAYPIIFDAVKSNSDNILQIELYDSNIFIYKEKDKIIIKEGNMEISMSKSNFNFYSNKPINKITIIKDKYGHLFRDIFVREYMRAATIIQNVWRERQR